MTNDSGHQQSNSPPKVLWIVFLIAVALTTIVGIMRPRDFFAAWLAAILWPWSVCIGALTFRLIHVLTGGRWGAALFPWMLATIRRLPLVAFLFVPWALGLHWLYPWTDPQTFAGIENVEHRQWFYQSGFVILRTVGYFTLWSGLAVLSTGLPWPLRAVDWQTKPEVRPYPGGEGLAGLGLVAILLSVTWAAIDWIMSLDPFFMSTLFGALVGMGALLSGMAMMVLSYCRHIGAQEPDDPKALSDVANLLLAFVMLWAYLSFAQFLIMWQGDLPLEAAFYQSRTQGLWNVVAVGLAVGGFAIPFACLMSRTFKKSPRMVATLAACLLIVRLIELWWFVLPHSMETAARFNWAAIPAAVVVGCLWILLPGGPLTIPASTPTQTPNSDDTKAVEESHHD
ncbi:MAG: hypothetical protein R3B91_07785 [Planctomycetaceae bacterium]